VLLERVHDPLRTAPIRVRRPGSICSRGELITRTINVLNLITRVCVADKIARRVVERDLVHDQSRGRPDDRRKITLEIRRARFIVPPATRDDPRMNDPQASVV